MTASGMGCKKSHLHSAGRYMATSVLVVLAEDAFEGVVLWDVQRTWGGGNMGPHRHLKAGQSWTGEKRWVRDSNGDVYESLKSQG